MGDFSIHFVEFTSTLVYSVVWIQSVSTMRIPNRETTIRHKSCWSTRRPPLWGINKLTKAKAFVIYQVLTALSVSSNHNIKLLLNLNDEILR